MRRYKRLSELIIVDYSWCNQEKMLKNIIDKHSDDCQNIIYELTHDGYDSYGPKSDLHDIWIWYKKGNRFYIDRFHTEEWYYDNSDNPIFELSYTDEIVNKESWIKLMKFNKEHCLYSEIENFSVKNKFEVDIEDSIKKLEIGKYYKISGLITCIGIVIKNLEVIENQPISKFKNGIGIHFIHDEYFDETLTSKGKEIIENIKTMISEWDIKDNLQITYVISKKLDGTFHKPSSDIIKRLKNIFYEMKPGDKIPNQNDEFVTSNYEFYQKELE